MFRAEDNTIKSKEEIKAAFEEAGVDLSQEIIASCNSGMTATVIMAAIE